VLGRLIALLKPQREEYRVYFFFPFYHVGGAEKVHAQIAQATGGEDCIIYFTKKSLNSLFYNEFAKSGCVMKDISAFTDNKWLYFVNLTWRGILSGYINAQRKRPLVFNGQCNFGYKISPWIKPSVPQLELIHSLCSFSYIRIPFIEYYHRTVMISKLRIQDHIDLYRKVQIPSSFDSRIVFILNGIPIPTATRQVPGPDEPLTVLYSGRSTPEKRVHLIAEIARQLKEVFKSSTKVVFLGEVKDAIPNELHPYCHFLGYQADPDFISKTYLESDILILVSDTEGFAMVIMEAMAFGLSIISTEVGEIPSHVINGVNGFLITDVMDEKKVIANAIEYISLLEKDPALRRNIGQVNRQHAVAHFGIDRFNEDYRRLFDETMKSFEQR
jgi:glycosyltransferase involved in cell wall biosynthesis